MHPTKKDHHKSHPQRQDEEQQPSKEGVPSVDERRNVQYEGSVISRVAHQII